MKRHLQRLYLFLCQLDIQDGHHYKMYNIMGRNHKQHFKTRSVWMFLERTSTKDFFCFFLSIRNSKMTTITRYMTLLENVHVFSQKLKNRLKKLELNASIPIWCNTSVFFSYCVDCFKIEPSKIIHVLPFNCCHLL